MIMDSADWIREDISHATRRLSASVQGKYDMDSTVFIRVRAVIQVAPKMTSGYMQATRMPV